MNINTIVVYSSDIADVVTHLNCESIKYDIQSDYMSNLDGDEKSQIIEHKVRNNIELSQQDIMTLSFVPLMSSKRTKSELTFDELKKYF
jgi:hypothetical protein